MEGDGPNIVVEGAGADVVVDDSHGGMQATISAKGLVSMDWLSKSDPLTGVFTKGADDKWHKLGQTEWQKNTHEPFFATTVFVPKMEEKTELKFSIYDLDDAAEVKDDDFMGSSIVTYGELLKASDSKDGLVLDLTNPKDKKLNKKLKKAKGQITLKLAKVKDASEGAKEAWSLPKCLAYVKKFINDLPADKKDDLDADEFCQILEQKWVHVDVDRGGSLDEEELRTAVWEAEIDHKGVPMPEGKFPQALQDVVDGLHKGCGSQYPITFWMFVDHLFDEEATDVKITIPPVSDTWAHVEEEHAHHHK